MTSEPSMLPLRVLAPAKINLGLFVGPVREDGRHELVTVMQSISLADELTLREAAVVGVSGEDGVSGEPGGVSGRGDGVSGRGNSTGSGAGGTTGGAGDRVICPGVPGPPTQNLAAAALAAFRVATGWEAPPLELRIDKRVPVAAGLGGGSGDAAAALRLAAAASGLGDEALLLELARGLGADVPAQVRPGRWLARGAGELLQALPAPCVAPQATVPSRSGAGSESRGAFGVLVLPSAVGLSTAAVYAQADRMGLARAGADLEARAEGLARALGEGAALPPGELLGNDLQAAACALSPDIDGALAQAQAAGADVTLLSGSGPTVLGLFAGPDGPALASAAALALASERCSAGAPAPIAAEPVGAAFASVLRAGR
jgi:4-diphosphocytidyl-2-C-methyl-D-erythritol kinase